jgi:hypothetical protein
MVKRKVWAYDVVEKYIDGGELDGMDRNGVTSWQSMKTVNQKGALGWELVSHIYVPLSPPDYSETRGKFIWTFKMELEIDRDERMEQVKLEYS